MPDDLEALKAKAREEFEAELDEYMEEWEASLHERVSTKDEDEAGA